ncbi:MAG: A/G-specific adenine glycosylase [Chloroflexi bacterium]|nr:A/G-specific adenine glycosylase [Chloroflexota bacterium]
MAPADFPVAASPELRDAILSWYAERGRDLAFRATSDPYAILVSEAMAQQTQVKRAAEYWTRFLVAFPTVQALAEASPAAVLRAWRGLGYNRRAVALRAAAVAIVRDHGGRVPDDIGALERLPGVGPYTARAVAALAYGHRVGAVDVNVRRVLARALGASVDAFTRRELQAAADASVPDSSPGMWTHALMDVGATFCKPRVPRCAACPARNACRYATDRAIPAEGTPPGSGASARFTPAEGTPPGSGASARSTPAEGTPPGSGASARFKPARVVLTTSDAVRERAAPFTSTSRWLRGRILDLLRESPGDAWAKLPRSIGDHDLRAITIAVAGLERDGLVERHADDPGRVRLPIA